MNFRDFVNKLRDNDELIEFEEGLSTKFGIPVKIKKNDGTAVFFKNKKMPIIANIASNRDLVSQALGIEKENIIERLAHAVDGPKSYDIEEGEYERLESLDDIPILFHYPNDGGRYISSGIVVINDDEHGRNSSFHRMMVLDKDKIVMRILPRHLNEYLKRGNEEFAICIGAPVQILIASAISCEINKDELEIANSLCETKFSNLDGHVVPDSEIVLIAKLTEEKHDEGPFMDLTETYDKVRKQPVFEIKKIYAKKNPIYHALLPGGLEHKTIMGMPREPTIFREVNKVADCKNVYITPGGCSWLHSVVQIKKGDPKEVIDAAFRGHSSLKRVIVVNDDIDIYDEKDVEWALATRFQADRDLIIKKDTGSSLDPSAGSNKETAKWGLDVTIPGKKVEFMRDKIPGE